MHSLVCDTGRTLGKLILLGVEFHGMDSDVMLKSLNVLVKSGKAQIFGNEDEKGVKFF